MESTIINPTLRNVNAIVAHCHTAAELCPCAFHPYFNLKNLAQERSLIDPKP